MSASCGDAPAPVVKAVTGGIGLGDQSRCPARRARGRRPAVRYGLPKWQLTLFGDAGERPQVIRLARESYGTRDRADVRRQDHGEGDATYVIEQDGVLVSRSGLPAGIAAQARIVQFDNVAALEATPSRPTTSPSCSPSRR